MTKGMKHLVWTLVGLMLILIASIASAATTSVTLAWDANTEADLAGYKLYQSATPTGTKTLVQTLGKVTTTVVPGLIDGTRYFVLTAFDTFGNESGFSNQVMFQSDTVAPATRTSLRIVSAVVVP